MNSPLQMRGLEAEDAASGAGGLGSEEEQGGAAERAGSVGGGSDGGEELRERRVFGGAEEMDEEKDGGERHRDADDPFAGGGVRLERDNPRRCGDQEQDSEASPFEGAAGLVADARFFLADGADPAFAKAQRNEGDPVEMENVEGTELQRAARRLTGEAVIVAECGALWAEAVDTGDDEHCGCASGRFYNRRERLWLRSEFGARLGGVGDECDRNAVKD